jgi:hypothetical protein
MCVTFCPRLRAAEHDHDVSEVAAPFATTRELTATLLLRTDAAICS